MAGGGGGSALKPTRACRLKPAEHARFTRAIFQPAGMNLVASLMQANIFAAFQNDATGFYFIFQTLATGVTTLRWCPNHHGISKCLNSPWLEVELTRARFR